MKKPIKLLPFLLMIFTLSLATVTTFNATTIVTEASSKVSLSKKKVTLLVGKTYTLKTKGTNKKAAWKTSKKSIASISAKKKASVKVTAKKVGTTTVTATISKKKYTCKITVVNPKLRKTRLSLETGASSTLKISGGSGAITWTSADKKIATVNSKGKVTAKKAGTVKITATQNSKKLTCAVTVKDKPTINPTPTATPNPTQKPANPTPTINPDQTMASYKIEYYYEKVGDRVSYPTTPNRTETKEGKIGSKVTASAITIDGYVYDTSKSSATASATLAKSGTVLKLYYQRASVQVNVEYYQQGIDTTAYSKVETKVIDGKVGDWISSSWYDKSFEGFEFDREERNYDVELIFNKPLSIRCYYSRNEYRLSVYSLIGGRDGESSFTWVKDATTRRIFTFPYGKTVKYLDLGIREEFEARMGLHTKDCYFDSSVSGSILIATITADDNAELCAGYRKLDQPLILQYDENKSKELFGLINAYRQQNGLNTLEWEKTISEKIAKITAGNNVYKHVSGTGPTDLSKHGDGIGVGGEGTFTMQEAINEWKGSPIHNSYLKGTGKTGAIAVFQYNDKYGKRWLSVIFTKGTLTDTQLSTWTTAQINEDISIALRDLNIPQSDWNKYIDTPHSDIRQP